MDDGHAKGGSDALTPTETTLEDVGVNFVMECQATVRRFEEVAQAEHKGKLSPDLMSDLKLELLAVTAHDSNRLIDPDAATITPMLLADDLPADKLFIGLAYELMETPRDEMPEALEYMLKYLGEQFDWTEIDWLHKVLWPVIRHRAEEHDLDDYALEKALLITRLIPPMVRKICDTLREKDYHPAGPMTQRLSEQYEAMMVDVVAELSAIYRGPPQQWSDREWLHGTGDPTEPSVLNIEDGSN